MVEHAPYKLLAELEKVKDKGLPPVHLWHPENVSEIDMLIQADGTWMYMGTPITRQRLVRLFSTVLRREGDEYYLVTPVEKCRISVEDVPFQAVMLENSGIGQDQTLSFTTDMADKVVADEDHPIRFVIDAQSGEPSPYVRVRDGLDAKMVRSVYYQLADLVATEKLGDEDWFGVWSKRRFFKIQENTTGEI